MSMKKKVNQYTKNGEFVRSFDSVLEAAKVFATEHNMIPSNVRVSITRNCCHKAKTAFHYQWRFFEETGNTQNISGYEKNFSKCRKIVQYSVNGKLICVHNSIREAVKAVSGANATRIIRCCQRKLDTAYGFIWRYAEKKQTDTASLKKKRKVNQYTADGQYIRTFDSIAEAAKALPDASRAGIGFCCAGRLKTSAGYQWKYADTEQERKKQHDI